MASSFNSSITSGSISSPSIPSKWESISNGLYKASSATSLYLSSICWKTSELLFTPFMTPIMPKAFNQKGTYLKELISRVSQVALGIVLTFSGVGLACGLLDHLAFQPLANALSPHLYQQLSSNTPKGNGLDKISLMSLNACMLPGCIPTFCDGLPPADSRLPAMAKLIQDHQPDIIALSEFNSQAAQKLFQKLKGSYSSCFFNMNPKPLSLDNNLCILSKVKVENHSYVPFSNTSGIKRGVFILETAKALFFITHLQNGEDSVDNKGEQPSAKRAEQLALIKQLMDQRSAQLNKPCFLTGDLNIERSGPTDEYSSHNISQDFIDPYYGIHPTLNASSATCFGTKELLKKNKLGKSEILDYTLLYRNHSKNVCSFTTQKVDLVFKGNKKKDTLSDHHGLLSTITFSK